MPTPSKPRRRFLGITATASALALTPGFLRTACAGIAHSAAAGVEPLQWRGIALGADAELRLYHPDPDVAQHLLDQSLAEIRRLESLFSLYRQDSALATLNRQGYLNNPPSDLVRLLTESLHFSRLTQGAFDPTVQPLWNLYAAHFSRPAADPAGPTAPALHATLASVGYQHLQVSPARIQLQQPGMAVTVNGIAQGYITDRITELLRAGGLDRALVDLGEIRGLDQHPNIATKPWQIGLARPAHQPSTHNTQGTPTPIHTAVSLRNEALATSGGYGTPLDPAGRHTHLFDPLTGHAQSRYRSVSVMARTATMADALSTAFSHMPLQHTAEIVQTLDLKAWFVTADGSIQTQTATAPAQT